MEIDQVLSPHPNNFLNMYDIMGYFYRRKLESRFKPEK